MQAQLAWFSRGADVYHLAVYGAQTNTDLGRHLFHRIALAMNTPPTMAARQAIAVFTVFAFAYFFSTLIRAITATLAPTLVAEFALNARDLGLLAGGYFLGFAAMQLPLGRWLDRHGPRKVIVLFLTLAVAGCVAFSMATSFVGLLAARVLCGVGVCACLMAPLTGYRRWYAPANQIRANAWMLMVGAFGMVASTLPVQWLVPLVGWRALFVGMGGVGRRGHVADCGLGASVGAWAGAHRRGNTRLCGSVGQPLLS